MKKNSKKISQGGSGCGAGEIRPQRRRVQGTGRASALPTPEGRKMRIVQRIAKFDLDPIGCTDLSSIVFAPADDPPELRQERDVRIDHRADLGNAVQKKCRSDRTRIAEPHAIRIRGKEPQSRKPDLRTVQNRNSRPRHGVLKDKVRRMVKILRCRDRGRNCAASEAAVTRRFLRRRHYGTGTSARILSMTLSEVMFSASAS